MFLPRENFQIEKMENMISANIEAEDDALQAIHPIMSQLEDNNEYEPRITSDSYEYHLNNWEKAVDRFLKHNSIKNICHSNGNIFVYDDHLQKKINQFSACQSIYYRIF